MRQTLNPKFMILLSRILSMLFVAVAIVVFSSCNKNGTVSLSRDNGVISGDEAKALTASIENFYSRMQENKTRANKWSFFENCYLLLYR